MDKSSVFSLCAIKSANSLTGEFGFECLLNRIKSKYISYSINESFSIFYKNNQSSIVLFYLTTSFLL